MSDPLDDLERRQLALALRVVDSHEKEASQTRRMLEAVAGLVGSWDTIYLDEIAASLGNLVAVVNERLAHKLARIEEGQRKIASVSRPLTTDERAILDKARRLFEDDDA